MLLAVELLDDFDLGRRRRVAEAWRPTGGRGLRLAATPTAGSLARRSSGARANATAK
jgi:hypothetical protein